MPRRVRDDVGRQDVVDEDIASGVGSPEREVQEECAVPAARRALRQDAEGVLVAAKDVLRDRRRARRDETTPRPRSSARRSFALRIGASSSADATMTALARAKTTAGAMGSTALSWGRHAPPPSAEVNATRAEGPPLRVVGARAPSSAEPPPTRALRFASGVRPRSLVQSGVDQHVRRRPLRRRLLAPRALLCDLRGHFAFCGAFTCGAFIRA